MRSAVDEILAAWGFEPMTDEEAARLAGSPWSAGDEYHAILRGRLKAALAENERLRRACAKEDHEIQQILGKSLGYPWFKDDQKNFPGATEADGVCVGEHVAATLAMEAAEAITKVIDFHITKDSRLGPNGWSAFTDTRDEMDFDGGSDMENRSRAVAFVRYAIGIGPCPHQDREGVSETMEKCYICGMIVEKAGNPHA